MRRPRPHIPRVPRVLRGQRERLQKILVRHLRRVRFQSPSRRGRAISRRSPPARAAASAGGGCARAASARRRPTLASGSGRKSSAARNIRARACRLIGPVSRRGVLLKVGAARDKQRQHAERIASRRPPPDRRRCRDGPTHVSIPRRARVRASGRSNEQQVGLADEPCAAVRKRGEERGDDRPEIVIADVVGVRPLAEDATRLRAGCARRDEEFAREERRDARHPGIGRLGDDHVVPLARQQQVRAAVADDQARARIVRARRGSRSRTRRTRRPLPVRSPTRPRARSDAGAPAPSVTPLPSPMMYDGVRVRRAAAAAGARAASASACRRRSTHPPCRRSPATSRRAARRTDTVPAAPSR